MSALTAFAMGCAWGAASGAVVAGVMFLIYVIVMSEWLKSIRERWTCWRKCHEFFSAPCCVLLVHGEEQGRAYMCKRCGITAAPQ